MNKIKAKCLSARKLPDTHPHPSKTTNPTLNLKSLSLSFYNSNTKKCKKQILYDWESFVQLSQEELFQDDKIVKEMARGKNKSMSLKREAGKAQNHEIRIRNSPVRQKEKQKERERQKERDRERMKEKERQRDWERERLNTNPLGRSMKSGNFHIKNLVIQNYYNSPYSGTQHKSITALRNKSQIKSVKQKKIDIERETIDRLKEYLKKV